MRELLVFGDKTFKIEVPDDAKITFGPWSPPKDGKWGNNPSERAGTLRIYSGKGKEDVLAVFAGVMGFRDLSLTYKEKVAEEVGDTVWKDDARGYERTSGIKREYSWGDPAKEPKRLPAAKAPKRKRA